MPSAVCACMEQIAYKELKWIRRWWQAVELGGVEIGE